MTATSTDYAALAREAAGNWRKFDSFAWWEKPDDPDQWTVVYTHNRDSGLLDQSNAAAIAKALDQFADGEDPDVVPERHSHWACGWVDGYALRVFRPAGEVTEAFKTWCDLQEKLSDYPVLDETDYSNREYDAALQGIREQGRGLVVENPPDGWAGQVFEWLSDHDDRELENRDDHGAYPSRDAVRTALEDLGLLDTD